jgi:hypothetical protein
MDFLIEDWPETVGATGSCHIKEGSKTSHVMLRFPNELIAHFHFNWLSPVKIRHTLIGHIKMIVYDDIEPTEKVRVYDRG